MLSSPDRRKGLDLAAKSRQAEGVNIQTNTRALTEKVSFDRTELGVILSLYGRMVAAGEWRDYGISCLGNHAVFSVFRRTAEHPLYRIEKHPALRTRQGLYAVIGADGQVLKRGGDLRLVLRVIEHKLIRLVGN